MKGAILVLCLAAAPLRAEPLFTGKALTHAQLRPFGFADAAAAWDRHGALLIGGGAGVRMLDGRAELALAGRSLRALDEDEAPWTAGLLSGLRLPVEPEGRIYLTLRVDLGIGADRARLLAGRAGIEGQAGPYAIGLGAGIVWTSLHSIDDPVPTVALTFSVAP